MRLRSGLYEDLGFIDKTINLKNEIDINAGTPATPYNEVVYLESLRKKGSFLLKFAMPPDFLSSNSDAARITGLSVRFECDDAGAN